MTDTEMLTALIHIKRHIVSKPIKAYIDSLTARIKLEESKQKSLARQYQVRYKMPLYELKKPVKIDVIV